MSPVLAKSYPNKASNYSSHDRANRPSNRQSTKTGDDRTRCAYITSGCNCLAFFFLSNSSRSDTLYPRHAVPPVSF